MKFVLKIEMGNDAMQTSQDLAVAIIRIANGLRNEELKTGLSSNIQDTNGNRIGRWAMVPK